MARARGEDQKENSPCGGRRQRGWQLRGEQPGGSADEPGPRGKKTERGKKERRQTRPEKSRRHDSASRARSPAPSALSSPGAQVGTLSRLKDTPLGPLGHRAPDHPHDLPEPVHHFAGRRASPVASEKRAKGALGGTMERECVQVSGCPVLVEDTPGSEEVQRAEDLGQAGAGKWVEGELGGIGEGRGPGVGLPGGVNSGGGRGRRAGDGRNGGSMKLQFYLNEIHVISRPRHSGIGTAASRWS